MPHPIRLMGIAISKGEGIARRVPLPPFWQGALLSLTVVGLSATAAWMVVCSAALMSPQAGRVVAAMVIFFGIALRCLGDEVMEVGRALEGGDLERARQRLSRIVGRRTSSMDGGQVAMAAIETAAENLVDGFTAPLFYAALAGPVGIMAYKAVNTLDSMIGYRNQRYARFGTFAARLDDAANYLPARLTLLLISLVAPLFSGISPWRFAIRALREARKHASPNSGLPEAAFALLLKVRLGGPARYGSRLCPREFMLPENPIPSPSDVRRAVRWLYGCGLLWAMVIYLYANFFA